jgi:hypothetical protein
MPRVITAQGTINCTYPLPSKEKHSTNVATQQSNTTPAMIHSSPSYSCLLNLEEKPNGLTTFAMLPDATTPVQPLRTCQQACLSSLDDAHFRDYSPLTVVFELHGPQEMTFEENDEPAVSLLKCPSYQEPLKLESGHQRARSNYEYRIRFCPTVEVTLIPSHRDYSDATKQLLWASTEEIRVNAVKAQMEMCLYEHRYAAFDSDYYSQDNVDRPEHRFAPLSRLQRAR